MHSQLTLPTYPFPIFLSGKTVTKEVFLIKIFIFYILLDETTRLTSNSSLSLPSAGWQICSTTLFPC